MFEINNASNVPKFPEISQRTTRNIYAMETFTSISNLAGILLVSVYVISLGIVPNVIFTVFPH